MALTYQLVWFEWARSMPVPDIRSQSHFCPGESGFSSLPSASKPPSLRLSSPRLAAAPADFAPPCSASCPPNFFSIVS